MSQHDHSFEQHGDFRVSQHGSLCEQSRANFWSPRKGTFIGSDGRLHTQRRPRPQRDQGGKKLEAQPA